jgi:hypothetical protein
MQDKMQTQRDEFDAAEAFAKALERHNATPIVDDDYPEVRHAYEGALARLIEALKANNRLANLAVAPSDVNAEVMAELERATRKFPTWPTDPLHAVAVLGEEFGELTKAVLEYVYEPHKSTFHDVHKEAVQTAAMALRFIMSLDKYRFNESHQHTQS